MHTTSDTTEGSAQADVEAWLDTVVIGHNLCPFAGRERRLGRIKTVVSRATDPQALIDELQVELGFLLAHEDTETTLIVHPWVLQDFSDYNQFLDVTDALLELMSLDGVMQIASFHPDYLFAGSADDDPANYTNRSPYPLLHLLREDSVERAVGRYGDSAAITQRNIEHLTSLGIDAVRALAARRRPVD